jgi:hypothetical protein
MTHNGAGMPSVKSVIFLLLFFSLRVSAQIGGESVYSFLALTNSARIAALGGNQVAINDPADLNLPFHNPALLNQRMANQLLFNYVNYLSDINYGYVSYAFPAFRYGMVAVGMHYINYGSFTEASELGVITGNQFKAGEYALHIIYAYSLKNWQFGISLKPVLSNFESYSSWGIAGDAGLAWFSQNNFTSAGLVARNFGTQITTYYEDGKKESLPFDLQAGISQKLAYAPIVFSLTAHHLNHWDLAKPEADENSEDLFVVPAESSVKQLMRHLLIGMEILPSQHFSIRAGYNYHLRQELKVEQRSSTVGFSLGFGVHINRFRLDYSISQIHIAGVSNHFSLAINLNGNY